MLVHSITPVQFQKFWHIYNNTPQPFEMCDLESFHLALLFCAASLYNHFILV